jgi:hypothetical protein
MTYIGSLGFRDQSITLMPPRKVIWLAVAGCLVLLLLPSLLPPRLRPRKLDLRIVGQPQMTNGALRISLILSNGTTRSLNIVDDASGGPFVVLDVGPQSNMPGTIGLGLGTLVNTLKLNLAPGATLMKTVTVTNPPPRFRLLVEVRDLARERSRVLVGVFRWLAVKAKLRKQLTQEDHNLLPASPWIENGHIATTTMKAAEGLSQTPTNGWSP